MSEVEPRRYRITGVLGRGGFGTVYRATMEGGGGFHKNVALKLLRDENVPDLTLKRFRDEARILGLVRDRAIVTVDPPTRLAGRWAVVMEYVDGASVHRLLQLGPIPAAVTAEIVQEVARVLDKVYRTPGPDAGAPLHLLHRDIKPANLQVTPDGEVKVLDFGIAKAEFAEREAHTQAHVGGTKGYIAPERLGGQDGPEGDVFSLGVTAHVMLTGERPTRRQMMGLDGVEVPPENPDLEGMIALATRMRSLDPELRPTARQVEEACAEIRRRSQGPSLRRWAETTVPQAHTLRADDGLVGSVLSETLAVLPKSDPLAGGHDLVGPGGARRASGAGSDRALRAVVVALGLTAMVAIGVSAASIVLGGGVVALNLGPSEPTPPVVVRTPAPIPVVAPALASEPASARVPAPASAAPAPPVPAPNPAAPAATEPTAAGPTTTGPTKTGPTEAGPAETGPAPAAPAVAPAPAAPVAAPATAAPRAAPVPITFTSAPSGAVVTIDGVPVGETPVLDKPLSPGTHRVKMALPDGTIERTITVGGRNPQRYVWKGGDKWESIY